MIELRIRACAAVLRAWETCWAWLNKNAIGDNWRQLTVPLFPPLTTYSVIDYIGGLSAVVYKSDALYKLFSPYRNPKNVHVIVGKTTHSTSNPLCLHKHYHVWLQLSMRSICPTLCPHVQVQLAHQSHASHMCLHGRFSTFDVFRCPLLIHHAPQSYPISVTLETYVCTMCISSSHDTYILNTHYNCLATIYGSPRYQVEITFN